MTNADMTIGIDHLLMSEDTVSNDKIVQQRVQMSQHNSPASMASTVSITG
jgi:hypothetical protein